MGSICKAYVLSAHIKLFPPAMENRQNRAIINKNQIFCCQT